MPIREKYNKILNKLEEISQYKENLEDSIRADIWKRKISPAIDTIRKLLADKTNRDEQKLKKECDYIFVGALIVAMMAEDKKWAKYIIKYNSKDKYYTRTFLYPFILESIFSISTYKVGSMALKVKNLPFTGRFNSACFFDLDSAFEPDHFNEYSLDTNPLTTMHPLTVSKVKEKNKKWQNKLAKELKNLSINLNQQLDSASERSDDDSAKALFAKLIGEINALTEPFQNKLTKTEAIDSDLTQFKNTFAAIMTKSDYVKIINAHRGSYRWCSTMDALAKLEIWLRQLPTWSNQPAFSLAHQDRFFSTKTAKVAEAIGKQVTELSLLRYDSWRRPK